MQRFSPLTLSSQARESRCCPSSTMSRRWPRSTAHPSLAVLGICPSAPLLPTRGPPCLGSGPPLEAPSSPSTRRPSTGLMSGSSAPSTPLTTRHSRPRAAGPEARRSTAAARRRRTWWSPLWRAGWAAAAVWAPGGAGRAQRPHSPSLLGGCPKAGRSERRPCMSPRTSPWRTTDG